MDTAIGQPVGADDGGYREPPAGRAVQDECISVRFAIDANGEEGETGGGFLDVLHAGITIAAANAPSPVVEGGVLEPLLCAVGALAEPAALPVSDLFGPLL